MTDEQIRVAIAEVLGWKQTPSPYFPGVTLWVTPFEQFSGRTDDPSAGPKHYAEDLNACYEMEKALTDEQRCLYANILFTVCFHPDTEAEEWPEEANLAGFHLGWDGLFEINHATARQRCIAVLRTVRPDLFST